MKKMVFIGMVFFLLASFIGANGQGETGDGTADSVSIMFQGPANEREAMKAVAERFTAETGIEVELRYTPHDVYNEKLAGAITSGDMPDILQLDAPFLSNYAWGGHLVAVDDYVSDEIIRDMTPSSISQCTYPIDDRLYAVGPTDSTVLLFGNRSYLERVGARIPTSVEDAWSMDEFNDILEKLAALPEVEWPLDLMRAYGIKTEWATYGYAPIFQSMGGNLIDRNKWSAEGVLDSSTNIAAAELIQEWVEKDWIVPAGAGDNQLYSDARSTALAWSGNWYFAAASQAMGDELVAIPLPDFGKGTVTPNGTWIYGITAKSTAKKTAGEYLNFIINDPEWRKALRDNGLYPGLKSLAAEYPEYGDPNKMQIAFEQSNYALPRPKHPAYPTITSQFMKAIDDIFNNADPKKALSEAAEKIDRDIADHDGYPPFGGK